MLFFFFSFSSSFLLRFCCCFVLFCFVLCFFPSKRPFVDAHPPPPPTLSSPNNNVIDNSKLLSDADKECAKANSSLSDARSKLNKLAAHQFTGSLYSEIEPELERVREALGKAEMQLGECDAVARSAREALDAAKRVERDVRANDKRRETEIKRIAKDEADCEAKANAYWQRADTLREEAASISAKLKTMAVDLPALTRRLTAHGEEFAENNQR